MAGLKFKIDIDVRKVKSNKLFPEAEIKAGISMLDWMSSGSQKSDKAPPIRTGVLASSGSVFYKGKLIGQSKDIAGGKGTPNKVYTGKNITWGFNTEYATKMHEDKLNPGPFSIRNANRHPGNQWMLEHLQKDRENYMKLIAKFIEKKMNKQGV